ncbi:MAG: S41 family peptidase [Myxococcota bacterium]
MIALLAAALAGNPQLETFDHVVVRVQAAHPADWDASAWHTEAARLRKHAKRTRTPSELRPVLFELLGTLGQSHFGVMPGQWDEAPLFAEGIGAAGGGTAGLAFCLLDDRLVVWRVTPGSPADVAGIRPGAVVSAIDGQLVEPVRAALFEHQDATVAAVLLQRWARSRVDGRLGETVALELDSGPVSVGRTAEGVFIAPALGIVPPMASVWAERVVPVGDHTVRYLGIESFVVPVIPRFQAAVQAARESDAALVIDLRGNPGGVLTVGQGLAGFLVSEPVSLGQSRSSFGDLSLPVSPRAPRQRFEGPVALLVDGGSASTSEILAAGLSEAGRVRVFGQPTAGMALPSFFETLPNGDVLQLAIGDYRTPSGARIEGVGVQPDEPVPMGLEALRSGGDPVLDAALAWLSATLPAGGSPE